MTAKDVVLAIIGGIGTAGGTSYAMEFGGSAIRGLSMEGRMTICNMAIEAGARAGMVAVDEQTIAHLKDRPFSPKWRDCGIVPSNVGAPCIRTTARRLRRRGRARRRQILPQVTWGHFARMVAAIDGACPIGPRRIRSSARAWSAPAATWA